MDIHVYKTPQGDGALCVGTPEGRTRPILWGVAADENGEPYQVLLASFHGEVQATAFVAIMDDYVDHLNRVIKHYADQHGDQTG